MSSTNSQQTSGAGNPAPVTHGAYSPASFSKGPIRGREVQVPTAHLGIVGIHNLQFHGGMGGTATVTSGCRRVR